LHARLSARVVQYNLSASSLADALLTTAKRFELPMGLEWVKEKETLGRVSLAWRGETVQAILDSIVKHYPGYSLQVEGGAIHVFRADLRDDRGNFLNLRVPDYFDVRQEWGGVINQRLQSVVQNIVSPRNLPPGAGEGFEYATGMHEKPLTLTLQGLTIREALEKLAGSSEHKMWVVTFSGGAGLTPTGFRRTETLWHPTPFPDRDQPMWDFLAWEQYSPDRTVAAPPSPR